MRKTLNYSHIFDGKMLLFLNSAVCRLLFQKLCYIIGYIKNVEFNLCIQIPAQEVQTVNNREDKKIYILVEPSYITPVWFSSSIDGIRSAAGKQKKAVRQLEELEELNTLSEKPKAIILISTNTQWTRHSIDYCRAENIRTILIGGMPSRFGEDVSGTIYSSKSSIDEMLNYFKSCNRKRIALLGINEMGSNDAAKAEVFLNSVRNLGIPASDDDIYYNSPDSRNPNERFFDNIGRYNAVICSNDYIAAYVLAFAKDYGITVPEDLYVAGLGDSILCQYTTPSLTSATRPYFKTGYSGL